MTKALISDLHLEENRPDIAGLFLKFLANSIANTKIDELYILGDFFEYWIGDDDLTLFHQKIINALKQATKQGLAIYFTHGNRDFLIGKKFLHETGCQLLPDEYIADLYGTPTLLMHGDTLCTLDVAYLKFRKKSRSWLFKKIMSLKSLEKRRALVKNYRAKSQAYTSTTADHIMNVTQDEVERVMLKHKVQHLIHGHTHRPDCHPFILNNQIATRTVLGAWHNDGYILMCHDDGSQHVIQLTANN